MEEELNSESLIKKLNEVYQNRHEYKHKMQEMTKLSGVEQVMAQIQKYQ